MDRVCGTISSMKMCALTFSGTQERMQPTPTEKKENLKMYICLLYIYLIIFGVNCDLPDFTVLRFGSSDKLGSIMNFIQWDGDLLPSGAFPREFTLCFNMRYQTMDYWSPEQKTILRIFGNQGDDFWLRINHSPPRGTIILNSGTLWSGGLGAYR